MRASSALSVLIEEEEDHVKAVMLEHPAGMPLSVHQSPDLVTRCYGSPGAPAALCFQVGSRGDLARWDQQLTDHTAGHVLRAWSFRHRELTLDRALSGGPDGQKLGRDRC
jgi:hypothetical protein